MIKILFVCHGNICRSTMAEQIMKHLVQKAGLAPEFEIDSAATSTEEIGNPIYLPAERELLAHGVDPGDHRARRITRADCEHYDYLIGMDEANIRNILRVCGPENAHKVSLLLSHTDRPGSVADPWYTGDFRATWRDAYEGCGALLKELTGQSPQKHNDPQTGPVL